MNQQKSLRNTLKYDDRYLSLSSRQEQNVNTNITNILNIPIITINGNTDDPHILDGHVNIQNIDYTMIMNTTYLLMYTIDLMNDITISFLPPNPKYPHDMMINPTQTIDGIHSISPSWIYSIILINSSFFHCINTTQVNPQPTSWMNSMINSRQYTLALNGYYWSGRNALIMNYLNYELDYAIIYNIQYNMQFCDEHDNLYPDLLCLESGCDNRLICAQCEYRNMTHQHHHAIMIKSFIKGNNKEIEGVFGPIVYQLFSSTNTDIRAQFIHALNRQLDQQEQQILQPIHTMIHRRREQIQDIAQIFMNRIRVDELIGLPQLQEQLQNIIY